MNVVPLSVPSDTLTPLLLPVADDTPSPSRLTERPSTRYELRERIAQGGVGAIYRAWDKILDRVVAVKLLLAEYPSSEELRRFSDEAHVLGQLAHPNIPPIYDRGTLVAETPERDSSSDPTIVCSALPRTMSVPGPVRPFIALKLIQGETLARLLAARGPGSGKWLAVFESLCHAVGYAHDRGYAHRDLKPANVMVGAFGEVQVMDWGLAKKLPTAKGLGSPRRLTRDTTPPPAADETFVGTVMGTPQYMAPEQARGETDRIGRRSDVFALGAILCELLTGATPLSGGTTQVLDHCAAGSFDDCYARLDRCDDDPALVSLAKHCLAARPIDRPADGRAVAAAVASIRSDAERRAREGELLRAREESRQGEVRRRRRVESVSAIAMIVTLTTGIVTATVLAAKARTAEQNATKLADSERAMNDRLRAGLRESEASQDVLFDVFRDLDVRDSRTGSEPIETRIGRRLADVANRFEPAPDRDPVSLARMQHRLGVTLLHLGEYAAAANVLTNAAAARERHVGPDDRETLDSLNRLGEAREGASPNGSTLAGFDDVIDRATRHLGADDDVTLSARINRLNVLLNLRQLDECVAYGEALAPVVYRKYGPEHEESLTVRNNLANAYHAFGKNDLAIPLFLENRPILEQRFGPDHPFTIISLHNLARAYAGVGESDRALAIKEEAVRRARVKFSPQHRQRVLLVSSLAWEYYGRKRWPEAADLFREVAARRAEVHGPDHDETAKMYAMAADSLFEAQRPKEAIAEYERMWPHWDRTEATVTVIPKDLNNLGISYEKIGDFASAARVSENIVRRQTKLSGPGHADTLAALRLLADRWRNAGRPLESAAALERILEHAPARIEPPQTKFLSARCLLGDAYRQLGRVDDAINYHRETLRVTEHYPPENADRLVCRNNLGYALQAAGRHDEALGHFRAARDGIAARMGPHAYATLILSQNYAKALAFAGRVPDAEATFDALLIAYRGRPTGPSDPLNGNMLANAALFLLDQGQFVRAEAFARELKADRDASQPESWTAYNARCLLGRALSGQKKYADAESELFVGFHGLCRQLTTIPPASHFHAFDAGMALIGVYQKTNRPNLIPAIRAKLPHELAPTPVQVREP